VHLHNLIFAKKMKLFRININLTAIGIYRDGRGVLRTDKDKILTGHQPDYKVWIGKDFLKKKSVYVFAWYPVTGFPDAH